MAQFHANVTVVDSVFLGAIIMSESVSVLLLLRWRTAPLHFLVLRKLFSGGSYKVYFLEVGLMTVFLGKGPKNGVGLIKGPLPGEGGGL